MTRTLTDVAGGETYGRIEVPVEGGLLACGRWGDGPRIAIASHGITANHLSWAHPAFAPPNEWTAAAEAYVRHDAVRCPDGRIASSVRKEAVLTDGAAAIIDPASNATIERVRTPSAFLWCPRGLMDQTPGLYPPEDVAEIETRLDHLAATEAADTNHYTVLSGEPGAALVAESIIAAALSGRS